MLAREISSRLDLLKKASQDFYMAVSALDNKYESREAEIRSLDAKIEKLKLLQDENTKKATSMLAEASDEASRVRKQANELMEQANELMIQAKALKEEGQRKLSEANARLSQAEMKERDNATQSVLLERKKKKFEEALQ